MTKAFVLRRASLLIFVFQLTFAFSASRAWGQYTQGNLVGTVTDSSGARVPSAEITVQSEASPLAARTVTAGKSGEFAVPGLPPGQYTVRVTAQGFEPAESKVTIQVSSSRSIAVQLQPKSVAQSVTVQGQISSIATQPIDVTTQVEKGVVTHYDLANIPLASRSFANIAFLLP